MDITFKLVDDDRRNLTRQRVNGLASKYAELFDALLDGKTIEIELPTKAMNRLRSAWSNSARTRGFSLHAIRDDKVYVAWAAKK